MNLDLARARADTPGVNRVAHLNNAGASLAPQPVIDAVMDHLRLESEVGPYEAAEHAHEAVEHGRTAVSTLLNCHSQEVAMFDSATRAWTMALTSLPFRAGDRVLISPMEYGSCYLSLLHLARRRGVRVEVLPVNPDGLVRMEELRARLDERVKLIAMPHVPTHDGLIYPVAQIGMVARQHKIPFLVDACQSVGQIPIDVNEIRCDMLIGSGRKYLRGPRGTGFLFVRRELAEQLIPVTVGLDGVAWAAGSAGGYRFAPAARRFDTWETNCATRIGLGVAIDYALSWRVEQTWPRIQQLAADLREDITRIPGVLVQDRGQERCGTVAITVQGWDAASVRAELHRAGINTWVCLANSACVDMQKRRMTSLLRISVHYYNSAEELARLCAVLESLTVNSSMHAVL
jgi:selenocysteine lyase/cysteine desulfurase